MCTACETLCRGGPTGPGACCARALLVHSVSFGPQKAVDGYSDYLSGNGFGVIMPPYGGPYTTVTLDLGARVNVTVVRIWCAVSTSVFTKTTWDPNMTVWLHNAQAPRRARTDFMGGVVCAVRAPTGATAALSQQPSTLRCAARPAAGSQYITLQKWHPAGGSLDYTDAGAGMVVGEIQVLYASKLLSMHGCTDLRAKMLMCGACKLLLGGCGCAITDETRPCIKGCLQLGPGVASRLLQMLFQALGPGHHARLCMIVLPDFC